MSAFRHLPTALALAAVLAGCPETDPKKPATWIAKLESKDPKKVGDAARELRKMKAKEAVPALIALLGHENAGVRDEAAYALEEIGDPSAVQPLIDGIDLASSIKGIDRANSRMAEALGVLGDRKATPALVRLLEGAREPLVKLAAVDALGALKDPAAVAPLLRVVDDAKAPPLLTKRAIIALGDMKAVEAVPALTRAMVLERSGVSFFVEAGYALFQIGAPAAEALAAIVSGDDKGYVNWATQMERLPAGYLSKSAIVLADLGETSTIPALVKLVGWKEERGDEVMQYIVRKTAAEALGRLRAKPGAAPIAAQVAVPEANVRESFAVALAHIGDTSVLPKLEAAAKNFKDTWSARQSAIMGVALLGNAKNRGAIDANLKKEEGENAYKNCMAEPSTELEALKEARCQKEKVNRPKFLNAELARLLAGEECKADVACWSGKLKDAEPKVRERAAYELGKLGDVSSIEALVATCKDEQLAVRRAAYIALDWFTKVDAAKTALKAKHAGLAAQFEEEKGRAHTIVVNEDLRRVVWKLSQL